MRGEIKSLRSEVAGLTKKITDLEDTNKRAFTKLTEEVIAVKLESRKHHDDNILPQEFKDVQKPFESVNELQRFDHEIQENEDKLRQFVSILNLTL